MRPEWLWDKDISIEDIQRILKDPQEERFVNIAALLLSRNNTPKEIFDQYLDKMTFVQNWARIKRQMRKDAWNDPRIIFWQAVYEKIVTNFKEQGIAVRSQKQTIRGESCQKIGNEIKDRREELSWSQKDLAEKLGISQQIISRIESGQANTSILTLKKISQVLGKGFNIAASPEDQYITFNYVVIPNKFIRGMSKEQKRKYLMITNMLRDLDLLQKNLLFIKNNDNSNEVNKAANTTATFFFLKTLISKNHEMWEFFQNESISNQQLDNNLTFLKEKILAFFSDNKERLFDFIRNKFGFHYESDRKHFGDIEDLIGKAMDSHEMDMWLSDSNEIFGSSNAVMLKVIFAKMRQENFEGDEEKLLRILFSLTIEISKIFHEFYINYLSNIVLHGLKVKEDREFKVKVPLLTDITVPLIVKMVKNG